MSSNQENQRGVSDQSDGCGELAFVPSAVSTHWLIGIFRQLELFQSPLHYLRERGMRKRGVVRWERGREM